MKIHSIPNKLDVFWLADVRAIHDKWLDYSVPLDSFREAVLEKGLVYAKKNKGIAWIVDSSSAVGMFSSKIQDFIETDILPAFASNGIKYFITVNTPQSALTEITVQTYSEKVGPAGIFLIEADTFEQAVQILKDKISYLKLSSS